MHSVLRLSWGITGPHGCTKCDNCTDPLQTVRKVRCVVRDVMQSGVYSGICAMPDYSYCKHPAIRRISVSQSARLPEKWMNLAAIIRN